MKRKSRAWPIVFILLQVAVAQPCIALDKPILMIPRQDSADLEAALLQEVGVMMKILQNNGYLVEVATASGKPLVTKKVTLTPDKKLADANPADYMGIILPCMDAADDSVEPETVAFLRKAAPLKVPIAAQHGSVLALNAAGLRDWVNDPQLKGDPLAKYGGNGIFRTGKVITSGVCGKRDGTVALTLAFIDCLREAE